MASFLYNRGAKILSDGTVDWDGATDVRVLLTTSSYTPVRTHNVVADVTNELSGTGYARKATASRTVTEVDGSNRAELDLADITYTGLVLAAGTPKYAVFYDEAGGTDASRQLIGVVDLGSAPAPDGSNYLVSWDATGVFRLTT